MATLARTEKMFIGTIEVETSKRNRWESFINFVTWMLTPTWVMDYAEELSRKHNPNLWV